VSEARKDERTNKATTIVISTDRRSPEALSRAEGRRVGKGVEKSRG